MNNPYESVMTKSDVAKHEKRKETVKEVLQLLIAKELTVSESEEVLEATRYSLRNLKIVADSDQIGEAVTKVF